MLRVYVGYDPRDHDAYRVCRHTLIENASCKVAVHPLKDWELRAAGIYWRGYHVDAKGQMWDDRDGRPFSTQFSFTRFAVPAVENYGPDWVLFCDADMMFYGDVAELLDAAEPGKGLYCVQHDHEPREDMKMDGVMQAAYRRKNWSSFMLMKPDECRNLTRWKVNNMTGTYLHGLAWIEDEKIGALPKEWNLLAGYDAPQAAKNIHFTLGTPDMALAPTTEWDDDWWDALDRADKGIRGAA